MPARVRLVSVSGMPLVSGLLLKWNVRLLILRLHAMVFLFSFQGSVRNAVFNGKDYFNTNTKPCQMKISLVEPSGIEPLTSCLQSRRSPS